MEASDVVSKPGLQTPRWSCKAGSDPDLIALVRCEKGIEERVDELVSHAVLPRLNSDNRSKIVDFVRDCSVIRLDDGCYQLVPLSFTDHGLTVDRADLDRPLVDPGAASEVKPHGLAERREPVRNVEDLVARLNTLYPPQKGTEDEKSLDGEVAKLMAVATKMVDQFAGESYPTPEVARELVVLTKCNLASIHLNVVTVLANKLGESAPIHLFTATREAVMNARHLDLVRLNLILVNTFLATKSLPLDQRTRPHWIARFELFAEVTKQMLSRGGGDIGAHFPADHKDMLYDALRSYRNIFKGRAGTQGSKFVRKLFTTQQSSPDIELAYLAVCAKEAVARLRSDRNWRARIFPFSGDVVAVTGYNNVVPMGAPPASFNSLSGLYGAWTQIKTLKKSKNGWFPILWYIQGAIEGLKSPDPECRRQAQQTYLHFMDGTKDWGDDVARFEKETAMPFSSFIAGAALLGGAALIAATAAPFSLGYTEEAFDPDKINRRHSWYLEYGIARALARVVEEWDLPSGSESLPEEVEFAFDKLKQLLAKHQPKDHHLKADQDRGLFPSLRDFQAHNSVYQSFKIKHDKEIKGIQQKRTTQSGPKEDKIKLLEPPSSDEQRKAFRHVYDGVYQLLVDLYQHHDPRVGDRARQCVIDVTNFPTAPRARPAPNQRIGATLFNAALNEINPAAVPFLERCKRCLEDWEQNRSSQLYVPLQCYMDRLGHGQPRELDQVITRFLEGSDSILLIHGPAGSGKSSMAMRLEVLLWKEYDWGKASPVPLYMPSSDVKRFIANPDFIRNTFRKWGIADATINRLEKDGQLVFLCDGLDEVGSVPYLHDTHLKHWEKSKFIFFFQTAFKERVPHYQEIVLPANSSVEHVDRWIEEVCIAPLTKEQIESYLPRASSLRARDQVRKIERKWTQPETYLPYCRAWLNQSHGTEKRILPFDLELLIGSLPLLNERQRAAIVEHGRTAELCRMRAEQRARLKAPLVSPVAVRNLCGQMGNAFDAIMKTNEELAWHLWENGNKTSYKRPTSFDEPLGKYYFSGPDAVVVDGPILGSAFIDATTFAWIEGRDGVEVGEDCCWDSAMRDYFIATVLCRETKKAVAKDPRNPGLKSWGVRSLTGERVILRFMNEMGHEITRPDFTKSMEGKPYIQGLLRLVDPDPPQNRRPGGQKVELTSSLAASEREQGLDHSNTRLQWDAQDSGSIAQPSAWIHYLQQLNPWQSWDSSITEAVKLTSTESLNAILNGVRFIGFRQPLTSHELRRVFAKRPGLRSIDLHKQPIRGELATLLEHQSSLQAVNLSHADITGTDLRALVDCRPSLISLNLSGCVRLQDEDVRYALQGCKKLVELRLAVCHGITGALVDDILACPALRLLDIAGCRGFQESDVAKLITSRPPLVLLDLSRLPQPWALTERLEPWNGLQALHLSNRSDIDDSTMTLIARYCPGLRSLSIPYSSITDQGLKVIGGYGSQMKELDLEGIRATTDVGLEVIEDRCKPRVLSIKGWVQLTKLRMSTESLEELNLSDCSALRSGNMRALLHTGRNLRVVRLSGCDVSGWGMDLAELVSVCPRLQYLDLSHTKDLSEFHLSQLMCSHPTLERVNIAGSNYTAFDLQNQEVGDGHLSILFPLEGERSTETSGAGPPGFQVIINQGNRVSDRGLESIARSRAEISRLVFSGSPRVTDRGIQALNRESLTRGLRNLKLGSCPQVHQETLFSFVRSCRQLTSLSLLGWKQVDGEVLVNLDYYCPELIEIDLTDCPNIRKEQLRHLVHSFPRLQFLGLGNNPNIDDDFLQEIGSYCPNLTQVSVANCRQVTLDGIKTLCSAWGEGNRSVNVQGCDQLMSGSTLDFSACSWLTDNLLRVIVQGLPQRERIETLVLNDCVRLTKCQASTRLSNLRSLQLRNVGISSESLEQLLKGLHQLKELDLSEWKGLSPYRQTKVAEQCRGLTTLKLAQMDLTNRDLEAFLEGNPTLSHLDVRACTTLVGNVMEVVLDKCPDLTELDFANCPKLSGLSRFLDKASHLPLSSLKISRCSSEELKNVCRLFPRLKTLVVSHGEEIDDDALAELINLRSIKHLALLRTTRLTSKGLTALSQIVGQLETLEITGDHLIADGIKSLFGQGCEALQRLNVGSQQAGGNLSWSALADACPYLRHLTLTNYDMSSGPLPQCLEYLQLNDCACEEEILSNLAFKNPGLTHVGITGPTPIEADVVLAFVRRCKQLTSLELPPGHVELKTLDLSASPWVAENVVRDLIRGSHGLEKIVLEGCSHIGDSIQILDGLHNHLGTCKEINLNDCFKIQDVHLQYVQGMRELQILRLRGCRGVTAQFVPNYLHGRKLQTLDLSECSQLSDSDFHRLRHHTSVRELMLDACPRISDEVIAQGVSDLNCSLHRSGERLFIDGYWYSISTFSEEWEARRVQREAVRSLRRWAREESAQGREVNAEHWVEALLSNEPSSPNREELDPQLITALHQASKYCEGSIDEIFRYYGLHTLHLDEGGSGPKIQRLGPHSRLFSSSPSSPKFTQDLGPRHSPPTGGLNPGGAENEQLLEAPAIRAGEQVYPSQEEMGRQAYDNRKPWYHGVTEESKYQRLSQHYRQLGLHSPLRPQYSDDVSHLHEAMREPWYKGVTEENKYQKLKERYRKLGIHDPLSGKK